MSGEVLPYTQVLTLMQSKSNNAVCGLDIGNLNDKKTWRPIFRLDANQDEVAAALAVLAAYDSTLGQEVPNLNALTPNAFISDASSNFSFVVPIAHAIRAIYIEETAGFAITGGLRIGTTNGGNDVLAAFAVGANSIPRVTDAAILKRAFSWTATQTLFVQAVTNWNGAHIRGRVFYDRLIA